MRRIDLWLVTAAILLLAGCAWLATVTTSGTGMPGHHHHGALSLGALGTTWLIMMVAMMAPAAAPIALVYATVTGRSVRPRRALALTASLVAGYLLAWSVFGLAAAITQARLAGLAMLRPDGHALTSEAGGVLLTLVGAYQLSPLKHVCLRRCRAPLGFLLDHWRDGMVGALAMGARHGAWCTGCCWALMALLFAVGTMSTAWMALITALALAERTVAGGHLIARLSGLALLGWGAATGLG